MNELMQVFFSRWKNLSLPAQECQKIFKCAGSIDNNDATKAKLIGYGFQLLENIDPNPDNFVCAGIIHTRSLQIGTLLRLEPNKQAQVGHHLVCSYQNAFFKHLSFYFRCTDWRWGRARMRCHNTCVKFYVNSSKIFLFLFIFTADMKKKYSDRSICCSNNFNNLLLHVDFKRHNFSFNVIEYYLISLERLLKSRLLQQWRISQIII